MADSGGVCDDDRRAGCEQVVEFDCEIRANAHPLAEVAETDPAASRIRGGVHPVAAGPTRRPWAGFSGYAFEQGKYVPAQWYLRIGDIECGAADWFAIAIDIDRAVRAADEDGNRPSRAPLRLPLVFAAREGLSMSGVKSFGASRIPGLAAKCGPGLLSSPMTTVQPREVIEKSSFEKS